MIEFHEENSTLLYDLADDVGEQDRSVGHVIRSGTLAIHCWRKSTNGLILHNVRIDDRPDVAVVKANSPAAWEDPEHLTLRDNHVMKDLQPGSY